jgi:hypothetical protein
MKHAVLAGAALLLAACGSSAPGVSVGSGGKGSDWHADLDRRCDELGGPGASAAFAADAACPDCAASDVPNTIDRADATWAELRAPTVSTGSMGVRATAPAGVVFPAGTDAAVTLSIGEGSGYAGAIITRSSQEWHVTIRTYLGAELADADEGDIEIREGTEDWRHIVATTTTQAFDSIEVLFSRPPDPEGVNDNVVGGAPSTQPGSVRIHEFCSDFDLSGLQEQ